MSDKEDFCDWLIGVLEQNNVPVASKQLMIDSGLNVFGFDLAMESFHRQRPEVRNVMPPVFAYEHENGILVFIKRPQP